MGGKGQSLSEEVLYMGGGCEWGVVFESPVRSGYFAHLALTETETG